MNGFCTVYWSCCIVILLFCERESNENWVLRRSELCFSAARSKNLQFLFLKIWFVLSLIWYCCAFHLYSEGWVGPSSGRWLTVRTLGSASFALSVSDASIGTDDVIMIASSLATPSGPEPTGLATPSGRSAGSPNCAVWSCVLSLSIRILKRKQMNRSCIFSSSHSMVVFIVTGLPQAESSWFWSDAGRRRRRSRSANVTDRASGVARRAASFRLSSAAAVLSREETWKYLLITWMISRFLCCQCHGLRVELEVWVCQIWSMPIQCKLCIQVSHLLPWDSLVVPCRPVSSDCPKLRHTRLRLVPLVIRYYYLSRPSWPGSPRVAASFLCIKCIEFQQPDRLWRLRWRTRPGPGGGAGDRSESWPRVQAWVTHIQVRSCALNWPTWCAVFKFPYKIMTYFKFCQWVTVNFKLNLKLQWSQWIIPVHFELGGRRFAAALLPRLGSWKKI